MHRHTNNGTNIRLFLINTAIGHLTLTEDAWLLPQIECLTEAWRGAILTSWVEALSFLGLGNDACSTFSLIDQDG